MDELARVIFLMSWFAYSSLSLMLASSTKDCVLACLGIGGLRPC